MCACVHWCVTCIQRDRACMHQHARMELVRAHAWPHGSLSRMHAQTCMHAWTCTRAHMLHAWPHKTHTHTRMCAHTHALLLAHTPARRHPLRIPSMLQNNQNQGRKCFRTNKMLFVLSVSLFVLKRSLFVVERFSFCCGAFPYLF